MSELDKLKEYISYLKLWLGILVATDISLIGWTASHFGDAKNLLIILAVNAIMGLTGAIFWLIGRIGVAINRLGDF